MNALGKMGGAFTLKNSIARARVPRLPAGAALGRREPRAFLALNETLLEVTGGSVAPS